MAEPSFVSRHLAAPRIVLYSSLRTQVQNMRRDVSQQMEDDRYDTARIRVENILREKGLIIALEHLEIFLELIAARVRCAVGLSCQECHS